jgi:ribose/xylose/arabinose/galactoside ABC-type transport system permease subunit
MRTANPFVERAMNWLEQNSALIGLVILVVASALLVPNFASSQNFSAILYQYSIIGFLALGQLLVILTSGIDLSQGSLVAFTSIAVAVLMKKNGIVVSVAGGMAATTTLGMISGLLVSRTKIPPFVVTLGMLGIARGLALLISDARPVSVEIESFVAFGRANWFGIPVSAILLVVLSLALAYFLRNRKTGRYIFAIGGSEESSRLTGIDVKNIKLLVYALSGLLTAIGGVIWTARLSSGSPIGANNYELESIAAVIVGGGSLFGGIGTISGTLVGVVLFGVINSVLNLMGISPYWQGTIKGILILLAVAFGQIRRSKTKKRVIATVEGAK